jgi:NADH-quinone oxidoreductase subunit H
MIVFLIYKVVLIAVILGLSLVIAMYSTLVERKFAGFIQDRYGPDRAGKWGILQPVCDGVKLFFKEEYMPNTADKFLYILGPCLTMLVALLTSAVIPWGGTLTIGDNKFPLYVASSSVDILFIFAVVSMGVYGVMIGGWASNNKFALLGAVRASSQMISYELAMGLSVASVIMMSGTLSLQDIVHQQMASMWNVVYQPLAFLIFFICALAETNRAPFDLPECEAELVGGYHTEYSAMKLGFYLFAEYINMFVSSAIISTLFFGGYHVPFIQNLGLSENLITILGTVFLFAKIFFFIILFMWVRWTLPRFRYDQLMKLGWRILLPLALVNLIITGVVTLYLHK